MKTFLSILCFPFAVFAHFTWGWWEKKWKGTPSQKFIFLLLAPLYGFVFIILNTLS